MEGMKRAKFNKFIRASLPYVLVAGLGGYAIHRVTDISVDIPDVDIDVPNPVSLEPDPAKVEVAVDPAFITTEETFDINCKSQITAAVGVRGFKNGPFGDGKLNKKIFGDFLVCAESITGTAQITKDSKTDEVVRVIVDYKPLEITHPRIDHEDGRNCANIPADATMFEANEKITERNEAINNGEDVDCEDGFWVSQLGGSDDLAEIVNFSHSAAQLAMSFIDPEAFKELEEQNQEDVKAYFTEKYPNAVVELSMETPVSYQQYVEEQLIKLQNEERNREKTFTSNGQVYSEPVFKSVTIEQIESDFCNNPDLSPETPQCQQIVAMSFAGDQARIILSEIHSELNEVGDTTIGDDRPLGPVGVDPKELATNNLNDFLHIED